MGCEPGKELGKGLSKGCISKGVSNGGHTQSAKPLNAITTSCASCALCASCELMCGESSQNANDMLSSVFCCGLNT